MATKDILFNKENYNIENELEKEEVRIKEKGINGIGENVYRDKTKERAREHGGHERERGAR